MDFEEIKRKALETAEIIADKSVEVAKVVAEKAKILAAKAKIMAEIAAEKETLRKNYTALGKLFYETYGDNPCEGLEQAVADIKLSVEKIDEKKAELEALKEEAEAVGVDEDEIEEIDEICAEAAEDIADDIEK